MAEVVLPDGWPRPSGYAQGVAARGRVLAIAGQLGADPRTGALAAGFARQFGQALENVLAVVGAAGGRAEDVIALTVFVTDAGTYRAARGALRPIWAERLGDHYPAMTLVEVRGLAEPGALLEVQGLAVLP